MEKELLFDTRLVNRWMDRKMVSQKEYEAHLKALNDAADNSENLELSASDHSGENTVSESEEA